MILITDSMALALVTVSCFAGSILAAAPTTTTTTAAATNKGAKDLDRQTWSADPTTRHYPDDQIRRQITVNSPQTTASPIGPDEPIRPKATNRTKQLSAVVADDDHNHHQMRRAKDSNGEMGTQFAANRGAFGFRNPRKSARITAHRPAVSKHLLRQKQQQTQQQAKQPQQQQAKQPQQQQPQQQPKQQTKQPQQQPKQQPKQQTKQQQPKPQTKQQQQQQKPLKTAKSSNSTAVSVKGKNKQKQKISVH